MQDPLQLREQPPAVSVIHAKSSPHPDIQRLYSRLAANLHGDSIEVRITLLTHLMYLSYLDIKETFAK